MSLSSTEGMVPGLDYSNVEGLQRKRLLAFVNHFLVRTVESLTVFARTCDTKLSSIQSRLKKLENALLLLEAKLDSVPILQEQRIEGLKLTSENSLVDVKVTILNFFRNHRFCLIWKEIKFFISSFMIALSIQILL